MRGSDRLQVEPVVLAAAASVGLLVALFATGFSRTAAANAAVHPATIMVLLALLAMPLIRWAVDGNKTLFRIAAGGLLVKAIGMYLRFTLTGAGDNRAYHLAGTQVAEGLSVEIAGPGGLPRSSIGGSGTQWLSYMVGWLYYIVGANRLTAFMVFTFLSFVGTLFFYRAAVSAIPELDRRRYALLLFYLPSMLFWPSTIGKEGWMIGFIGLAALGASGLVRHRFAPVYFGALALGLVSAGLIRPHVVALALTSLIAAIMWPTSGRGSRRRQIVIVLLGFGFLSVLAGQVSDFFGGNSLDLAPILDFTQGRTSQGGSQFNPTRITGPIDLIPGAISVLFRPFIFEADSTFQLLGSLESLGLLVFAAFSFERLRSAPRLFLQNGYVRFAVIYALGFIVAFSAISNFGILARQRAQLWPLFLVLLALPPSNRGISANTRTRSGLSTGAKRPVS